MKIWALSDPHLSLGIEGKKMDIFGPQWTSHDEKIAKHIRDCVQETDILLIPGDLSWAMKIEDAKKDLDFIGSWPGIKLICKGNHDYWWPSNKKLMEALPPSVISVQGTAYDNEYISVVGVRLWDNQEFNFDTIIDYRPNPKKNVDKALNSEENEKIFLKELHKLEEGLKLLDQTKYKILLCHYPPLGTNLAPSRASKLIENYGVDLCVFGHLHNVKPIKSLFGKVNKTRYVLTSCDYLDFDPILLEEFF